MKWINTKIEFTWDSKEKKYVETDVEGYHYTGEVAQCGGGDSFGSGESVMISGSLEGIPHISMSVGDKVLSADITGLPDTDAASEYLLWMWTGSMASFAASGIALATSSIETTGSQEYINWLEFDTANGISDNITITGNHTMMVYSGSTVEGEFENSGVWYFEYASELGTHMRVMSSSLEPIAINAITAVTASESASFFRFDIEPHDVYFVDGVLVHN